MSVRSCKSGLRADRWGGFVVGDQVLVLVHPASACGSAEFSLGRGEARLARTALLQELRQWRGGIVVIDGDFSEELATVPIFNGAIDDCLARARDAGVVSARIDGPPAIFEERFAQWLMSQPGRGQGSNFVVSGVWFHPKDGGGCVGAIYDVLRNHGCTAEVSESAMCMWECDGPQAERGG